MAKIVKLKNKDKPKLSNLKKTDELKDVVNDMKDILDKIETNLDKNGSDKSKNTSR